MDLALRVREILAAIPTDSLLPKVPPSDRPPAWYHTPALMAIWIGTSPTTRKVAEVQPAGVATYAVEDRPSFAWLVPRCLQPRRLRGGSLYSPKMSSTVLWHVAPELEDLATSMGKSSVMKWWRRPSQIRRYVATRLSPRPVPSKMPNDPSGALPSGCALGSRDVDEYVVVPAGTRACFPLFAPLLPASERGSAAIRCRSGTTGRR